MTTPAATDSDPPARPTPPAPAAIGPADAISAPPPAPPPPETARQRRARRRKRHRVAALACLLAPGVFALLVDVARRAGRVFGFDAKHAVGYWFTSAIVIALWAALLFAAAVRQRHIRAVAAGVFAVLFTFAAGTQAAFFSRFNVYASFDSAFYSDSFPLVFVASFPRRVAGTLACLAVACVVAIALLAVARSFVRPRGHLRRFVPLAAVALVIAAFALPASYRASVQSSPPDLIYFHGLSRYANERLRSVVEPEEPTLVRVQRRFPAAVPRLEATPPARRNVVFLLQESQRADVSCIEYKKDCKLATRATNNLLPRRFPFVQMRAAASSTFVAISNLWAGVDPTGSFEQMHSAPLVWEYAHAAGYDTAYWTSQNLIFGNARLYVQDLPLSQFAGGTNLDPTCDTLTGARDDLLSEHVIAHWSELKEPFFAVVHYSNLHRPRRLDRRKSPFQPSGDKGVRTPEGKNHYKNAVYLSDLAVARLVKHIRGTPSGKRTVLVYTSDHGEAMREHRNENDHSSTVFDEEIRVPTWIDAPDGTLSAKEKTSLAGKKETYLVQYDLAATLIDLLGVWDAPGFRRFRDRIIGWPLTRPETHDKPVPLTNVSWVWEYHLPNWGMIQGSRKALARASDDHYECYDLATDPDETDDLGEMACLDLIHAANDRFRILPREMRMNMRSRPDIWGEWPPRPRP